MFTQLRHHWLKFRPILNGLNWNYRSNFYLIEKLTMRELLAYSNNGVVEEKLTLRVRANSDWDVYIPTAWYSTEGTQDCEYDWIVGVDSKTPSNYKGTGTSNGKIRVGFWYTPLTIHTVVIKPNEEKYGWLRAFWYKGTDIGGTLINIVSDKSYNGYALSEIYSWDYFKAYQYYGCINLVNTDEELLPDTLEIIGDYYMYDKEGNLHKNKEI